MAAAADRTASAIRRSTAGRHRRRRDVEGFLEEWTVERIGLVEQGEHVQRAVMHQPFKRKLPSGDEAFDQDAVVRLVPFRANLRQTQERAQPVERDEKLVRDRRPA